MTHRMIDTPKRASCVVCGRALTGQQRKYCSRRCINREWYRRNHEQQIAYHRRYRLANRERNRASHRRWYLANRARALAASRAWLQANQHRRAAYARSRRAAVEGSGGDVSDAAWNRLLLKYAYACGYCGDWTRPLTADHRIPLSRGGLHTISNLIPACRPCNSRKGALTEDEFRRKIAADSS